MIPTGGKVFILPDWDKEEKSGSIFLPQCRIRDLPNTGVIVAVRAAEPVEFKVGDHVVYNRYKQQLTDIPGEKQTLTRVKIEDVLALII
jgi:co-chaperonin GroES (HSP10)